MSSPSSPHPNILALLGEKATKSLFAIAAVNAATLASSSASKIMFLGLISANNNSNDITSTSTTDSTTAAPAASTPNSWIYTQVPEISSIQNPKIRRKAATLLAEGIRKCAAVDHGHSARDGSLGAELKSKLEKSFENLIPKVEYVDIEDRVENVPVDIFFDPSAQNNKNAKHRSGARFKNEKRLMIVDNTMTTMLRRCATDEQKEQLMTTRPFQALAREKEDLTRKISSTTQEIKNQAKAGERRGRDGNVVGEEMKNNIENKNDDDDDDYYSGL